MFLKFFVQLLPSEFYILQQIFASSSYHSPILLEGITKEELHLFSQKTFRLREGDDKNYFWFEWQRMKTETPIFQVQLTKKASEFLRRNKDIYLMHRLYRFTKIRSKYTKIFLPYLLSLEKEDDIRIISFTPNQLRKILQISKNQYAKESDFIKRCLRSVEKDFPDTSIYDFGSETVSLEFEKRGKKFYAYSTI